MKRVSVFVPRVFVIATSCVLGVMSGFLSGCGVHIVKQPVVVPSTVPGPSTTVAGFEQSPRVLVRVYFVRNGRFEFLERSDDVASDPTVAARNAFVNLEGQKLSQRERQQGFSSPIDAIIKETSFTPNISVREGIAEVDISGEPTELLRSLSPETRDQVFAQVALTVLLATPGIGGVHFVADGVDLEGETSVGKRPLLHVDDFGCFARSPRCDIPRFVLPPKPIPVTESAPSTFPSLASQVSTTQPG
jgi:hypothetical protein